MQEHERWLKIVDQDLKSAKALLKVELFSTKFRYSTEFDLYYSADTKNKNPQKNSPLKIGEKIIQPLYFRQ